MVHRQGGDAKPVKLAEISSITGISTKFLEQLVISLKSHGILRGICGRNGGYLLARPVEDIRIGDVLTAVIGPIDLTACAGDTPICMSSEFCESRLMWRLLAHRMREVLDSYSIADLSDKAALATMREAVEKADHRQLERNKGSARASNPGRYRMRNSADPPGGACMKS